MRAEGIILSVLLLAGCSLEQVDDAFLLPMPEYDAKWNPELIWTMEDILVYTNREYDEMPRVTPEYLNGTCLPNAERKYELAQSYGYQDLEIVVIKLNEDTALKADWSNGWPTHAVLRHQNTIYDNGFISRVPFDIQDLSRYGEIIPDQWSRYHKAK
jgi:hypothetical protein